nr:restriction endonuclease subunit S [uncultured Undibacterium sp.]
MSSDVVEQTIASLCLLVVDCPHSTPAWTESGVVVLRNQNIKNGRLDQSSPSYTDEAHYQARIKRAEPTTGDIVMTREAPMGDVCMIPKNLRCCLGQRQVLLRPDPSKVDGRFLLFALQSPYVQHQIGWSEGTGSTVSNLRIPVLEALKIPTPSLAEQKEIAISLGALDDRINLLSETNSTLEAIAQALFKSWFVDFDPVHAKQQGRIPEGMDEATAALFPDSFEESELGLVPKGWTTDALSTFCTITSGKRPNDRSDEQTENAKVPLYGGAGVMGFTSSALFNEAKVVTGRVGTLGKVHIAYPPFWASDNVLVITPKERNGFLFAFHWVNSIDVLALNRGSTQPLLTQKDLGNQIRVLPDGQILSSFASLAEPIYEKIELNRRHIESLAEIRDALLPRLISGFLRLPDAPAD